MYATHDVGFPSSLISWIYKYARRNYWRVAAWYDIEDLIQDGMVVAIKCRNMHPEYDEPRLAGAIKFAFHNLITDLSNKRTVGKCLRPDRFGKAGAPAVEITVLDGPAMGGWHKSLTSQPTQLSCVLESEAPNTIQAILSLFKTEVTLAELQKPLRKKETLNDRLCTLTHQDKAVDLCGQIRSYFSNQEEEKADGVLTT